MPSDSGYQGKSNMDVTSGALNSSGGGGDKTPHVAAAIALLAFFTLVGFHFTFKSVVAA